MMSSDSENHGDPVATGDPVPGSSAANRLAGHEPFLKARARRELGPSRIGVASASDFEQDAWVAVLEAARRGQGPAPTPPAEARYLWTTLLNKIRQAIRKTKAEKNGGGATIAPLEGDGVPGQGTSPSAKVRQMTREECLEHAMSSLSARDQEVLRLKLVEDRPREEIAELLGVSARHVGNLYRDALERLRTAYTASGGPGDSS